MSDRKTKVSKQLPVRHCICGRRLELNTEKGRGHHPSRWEVKAGVVCMGIIGLILYFVKLEFFLYFLAIVVGLLLLVTVVKWIRGHRFICALRDGCIVTFGLFANVLEALNIGNWP